MPIVRNLPDPAGTAAVVAAPAAGVEVSLNSELSWVNKVAGMQIQGEINDPQPLFSLFWGGFTFFLMESSSKSLSLVKNAIKLIFYLFRLAAEQ